jgi:hypothetical protein
MCAGKLPYDFAVDDGGQSDGSTPLLHRFDDGAKALAWAADVRQLLSHDD